MSYSLKQILTEALEDEYKARASYRRVIEEFGAVRPFINIERAEDRHVRALLPLFGKYGLDIPEDDWESRVVTPASLLEASEAGVQAEIDNGAMYDRLLAASGDYPDVQRVLRNLQRASQERHLPAFQRAVQRYSGAGMMADMSASIGTAASVDRFATSRNVAAEGGAGAGSANYGFGKDSGFGGHGRGGCGGRFGGHGRGGGRGRCQTANRSKRVKAGT